MRKHMLFIFLSTLLSALLLTGCGSDQNTVSENAIPEESTAGHIAPISDLLVIEACEELSADPSDYLLIADGTDISKIQLHFEEVDSLRNGDYPVSASYGEEIVEFTIQIEDTIPPVITLKENIPAFSPYEDIYSRDLAEAYDISDVDVFSPYFVPTQDKWSHSLYFEEPGEYQVEIQAGDMNGNKSTMTLTVTVRELDPILDPEMVEQIQKDDALSPALKDYLLGNAAAVIGKDVDFENIQGEPFTNSPIPSGQSATIQDMCDMIKAGHESRDYNLFNINYAILDCGMDGTPDLAVRYCFGAPRYARFMVTIIHEENGVLTLSYAHEDGERSWYELYRDGYFRYGGSGGADNHYFHYAIFDKSGNLKDIYDCHATLGSGGLEYIDPDGLITQEFYAFYEGREHPWIYEEDYEEMIGDLEVDEYTIGGKTYWSTYPESDPEDTSHKSLPYYLSLCEEHGTSFYTYEEIDRLVKERMASLGFSDWKAYREHTEEDEVEWLLLLGNE